MCLKKALFRFVGQMHPLEKHSVAFVQLPFILFLVTLYKVLLKNQVFLVKNFLPKTAKFYLSVFFYENFIG